MKNTTEVDYMDINHDDDDPSTHDSPMMMEDHDEVYDTVRPMGPENHTLV